MNPMHGTDDEFSEWKALGWVFLAFLAFMMVLKELGV